MNKLSRSWIQTVRDWIPTWPKRQSPSESMEVARSDPEVKFNRIPDQYSVRDTSAETAPAVFMSAPYRERNVASDKSTCSPGIFGFGQGDEGAQTAFLRSPVKKLGTKMVHSTPVADKQAYDVPEGPLIDSRQMVLIVVISNVLKNLLRQIMGRTYQVVMIQLSGHGMIIQKRILKGQMVKRNICLSWETDLNMMIEEIIILKGFSLDQDFSVQKLLAHMVTQNHSTNIQNFTNNPS